MIIWSPASQVTQYRLNQRTPSYKNGNTQVELLIDSGSVRSILPKSLASQIVENSPLARWLMIAPPQELKTFSIEPINVTGMIQAPIASNGWRVEEAEFVVVHDGLKPLVGRDLFDALGISVTQTPKHEDEETVTPNELLPEDHWGNSRSDDEIERNMCKATKDATKRERLATDNESRFLRTTKAHRPLPLKEHAIQLNIARKKHLHKRSKKNLDGLYEVLAPGSVVQKTDQYTSVIREPGKVEVTVRNSDIAKFGTREERKTKLTEYINRRGPRTHEKTTEAKILSHIKESTRIQKGDRKMKHRKRETGSGVSSNKSNIARAMRVRIPKIQENFAPQVLPEIPEAAPEQQIITGEVMIAPPPTNNHPELILPSTSAPAIALQQIPIRATKRTRKSPKYYGYNKEDSSGESTNSCPPNFAPPPRKRHVGDFESIQPSVVQTIVDTASRVEPIENDFPSPIIGQVSPTDARIRPADHSTSNELIIDEEGL